MANTDRTPTVGGIGVSSNLSPRVANPDITVPDNNVITISGTLSLSKNLARSAITGSVRAGQAGDEYVQAMQDVGTVEELLNVGEMGMVGWCAFRNKDTTNYVELGKATGQYTLRLGPGEFHGPVRWNGPLIFAKADTATCKVEYLAIEL